MAELHAHPAIGRHRSPPLPADLHCRRSLNYKHEQHWAIGTTCLAIGIALATLAGALAGALVVKVLVGRSDVSVLNFAARRKGLKIWVLASGARAKANFEAGVHVRKGCLKVVEMLLSADRA